MRPRYLSGLLRTLDPRVSSNAFVVTAMVLAGAGVGLWQLSEGAEIVDAGSRGVGTALGVLAAWALGREVAPDDPWGANLAMPVALVAALVRRPDALAAFSVVLAARIAVRSTGLRPTIFDHILMAGLAVHLARHPTGIGPAFILAVTLIINARWDDRRAGLVIGGIATVAVIVVAALGEGPNPLDTAPGLGEWLLFAGGAAAYLAMRPATPSSRPDFGTLPLTRERLVAARLLALAGGVAAAVAAGGPGVLALAPVWAASLGYALVAGGRALRRPTPHG